MVPPKWVSCRIEWIDLLDIFTWKRLNAIPSAFNFLWCRLHGVEVMLHKAGTASRNYKADLLLKNRCKAREKILEPFSVYKHAVYFNTHTSQPFFFHFNSNILLYIMTSIEIFVTVTMKPHCMNYNSRDWNDSNRSTTQWGVISHKSDWPFRIYAPRGDLRPLPLA